MRTAFLSPCAARRLAAITLLAFLADAAMLHAQPGSLDLTFKARVGGSRVYAVEVLPEGGILIAGEFQTVNGAARMSIARLHANGGLDSAFDPGIGPNSTIYTVASEADGKIVVGGSFTSFDNHSRNLLARLNSSGSLNKTFIPHIDNNIHAPAVLAIAVAPDQKIIIGGSFTTVEGHATQGLARLDPDGALDPSFDIGTGVGNSDFSGVSSIAIDRSGRIIIAGEFSSVHGITKMGVARLTSSGAVDPAFDPGTGAGGILTVALQSDGKILVGGSFGQFNGVSRAGIARLNSDGTLDSSFDPGSGTGLAGSFPWVNAIAIQEDGKLVAVGGFIEMNGQSRLGIARLNPDGSLDNNFVAGVSNIKTGPGLEHSGSGIIDAVALQPNGKLLIGGLFTTVDGTTWPRLARLYGDLRLAPVESGDSGLFALKTFSLPTGEKAIIEASTNFSAWTPIFTNKSSGGDFSFQDPRSKEIPKRFYRVRIAP